MCEEKLTGALPPELGGEQPPNAESDSGTENKIVYVHDKSSFNEIRDEIYALKDLFTRRLMNDKQKNELIQVLTDEAKHAYIEPFLYDLILLLDRMEYSDNDTVRSIREELTEILERRGVTVISESTDLNPKYCKVIRAEEKEDIVAPQILRVVRKGYVTLEKVIRPLEVIVAVPKQNLNSNGTEQHSIP